MLVEGGCLNHMGSPTHPSQTIISAICLNLHIHPLSDACLPAFICMPASRLLTSPIAQPHLTPPDCRQEKQRLVAEVAACYALLAAAGQQYRAILELELTCLEEEAAREQVGPAGVVGWLGECGGRAGGAGWYVLLGGARGGAGGTG